MNTTKALEMLAIVAGLLIIYKLWQQRQAAAGAPGSSSSGLPAGAPTSISNSALPGQPGYAWQYFSDGTAIGPDGSYYLNGQKIYDPFMPLGGATVSA